jgi:regulator of replication initiation timing
MYRIILEEWLKKAIHDINKIVKELKPMMNTKQQLQTTNNRLMSSLDSSVESMTQEFNARKASTVKNRPKEYNKQGRSCNAEFGCIVYTGLQDDPDDENCLFLLHSKDLIKVSWHEVFELACYSKAPASWSKVFADCEDLRM